MCRHKQNKVGYIPKFLIGASVKAAMANFSKGLSQHKRNSLPDIVRTDQARSKRSRFITLVHAATKSFTNFSFESRTHRLPRGPAAGNANRRSSRRGCRST